MRHMSDLILDMTIVYIRSKDQSPTSVSQSWWPKPLIHQSDITTSKFVVSCRPHVIHTGDMCFLSREECSKSA